MGMLLLVLLLSISSLTTDLIVNSYTPYEGWWQFEYRLTGVEETPPFSYMEITGDGTTFFYDSYGNILYEGAHSVKDGFIIPQEDSEFGNIEYDSGISIEQGIRYLVITGDYYYLPLEGKPVFSNPNEEPYNPFEGSDGLWAFDENSSEIAAPYFYLEVSDGYVVTYDAEGTIIDEIWLYYDESGGLHTGNFIYCGEYLAGFGMYDDVAYFELWDSLRYKEGYDWEYYSIDALPLLSKKTPH